MESEEKDSNPQYGKDRSWVYRDGLWAYQSENK